jgi:hypothetical protein
MGISQAFLMAQSDESQLKNVQKNAPETASTMTE